MVQRLWEPERKLQQGSGEETISTSLHHRSVCSFMQPELLGLPLQLPAEQLELELPEQAGRFLRKGESQDTEEQRLQDSGTVQFSDRSLLTPRYTSCSYGMFLSFDLGSNSRLGSVFIYRLPDPTKDSFLRQVSIGNHRLTIGP
jgi:hypothetical protein